MIGEEVSEALRALKKYYERKSCGALAIETVQSAAFPEACIFMENMRASCGKRRLL